MSVLGQTEDNPIKIIQHKHLLDLPSASGIDILNDTIYVIGDDSPYLFQLDYDFSIIDKFLITGNDSIVNGRVPYKIKSDFESMDIFSDKGELFAMILSSGSKKIKRDSLHIISLSKDELVLSKNVRSLFTEIGKQAGFKTDKEINIEALALNDDKVFMLQRGNNNDNIIISLDRTSFIKYLENNGRVPELNIYEFSLPSMQNTVSGFSGVCLLPYNSGLLFTASLEATEDSYNDGEILGSYIGIINFEDLEKGKTNTAIIKYEGKVLKTKLEGISIKYFNNNKINAIAVSDNDNGTSWMFEFEIDIYGLINKH